MLNLKEIKHSSSIRLQNGHLVVLTHLRSISTDTASIETLGFCLCYINVFVLLLSGLFTFSLLQLGWSPY